MSAMHHPKRATEAQQDKIPATRTAVDLLLAGITMILMRQGRKKERPSSIFAAPVP
eukprot:CAMPEP_0175111970 /NCGR_PEP_ID=MMETSP0086_2-20121207/15153_1 /TAXON_ID=136419 /ORGANISM="Unknown Unknown, Strain D1" /LENGTH=55 /DNA_ID=CAMNT_0016390681 /DNA_START=44 /DNA_END=214 /DNA_ORIENTATION=-